MVKVSQLMIGDWLKYGEMDIQVGSIDVFGNISLVEPDWQDHQDEFDYIPLTESILNLNGFNIDKLNGVWKIYLYKDGKCLFDCDYKVKEDLFVCRVGSIWHSIVFRYVHELQHQLTMRGLNDIAIHLKLK